MHSIHSLNLLPPENRTRLGHMRLTRFFIYVYSGSAVLLLIGIILLLPTYFFLHFQNRGILELTTSQHQATESIKAREIINRIQRINAMLGRFETSFSAPRQSAVVSIEQIVRIAPAGITLSFLSFEKESGHIDIRGHADTRNDLLEFVSALRNHSSFDTIESPVENILHENDISFTLSFSVVSGTKKP